MRRKKKKGRKAEEVMESGFLPNWSKGRREGDHGKGEGGHAREGRQASTASNAEWVFPCGRGAISKATVSPGSLFLKATTFPVK